MSEDRGGLSTPLAVGPLGPALTLFLTGVVAIALVGFVVGVSHPVSVPTAGSSSPSALESSEGLPSVTYSELRQHPIGPNRDFQSWPVAFATADSLSTEPRPVTAASKRLALDERSERRAFNGAPPTIPHAVDATSSAACLGCHGGGAVIGDRVARPIPHAAFENCQQCHAAELDVFEKVPAFAHSSFEGLPEPTEGSRAWPGAPPVMPHSTQMREECIACHGPAGREGLRTSHPERKVCTQCHASSADLERRGAER